MPATLLCVDDHEPELALRKEVLQRSGYTVLSATDGFGAVEIAEQSQLACVVLDYRMDGMDGEAIAKVLKARQPQLPIIMLSGYEVPPQVERLVDASISKAQPPEVLLAAIAKLVRRRESGPPVGTVQTPAC